MLNGEKLLICKKITSKFSVSIVYGLEYCIEWQCCRKLHHVLLKCPVSSIRSWSPKYLDGARTCALKVIPVIYMICLQEVCGGWSFYHHSLQMTVRDALNSAIDEEMSADPKVFVMGEEVFWSLDMWIQFMRWKICFMLFSFFSFLGSLILAYLFSTGIQVGEYQGAYKVSHNLIITWML